MTDQTNDDYDFERYEKIVTSIIQDGCSFDDEPEYLEIGEDCCDLPEIKVIFDGFGLAEECYYNGKTYTLVDGEVMVGGENYSDPHTVVDPAHEDYDLVKEKLDLYQEYADGDGPRNPNMRSYAVFIDHRSGDDGFEFPPHDLTPWALVHRPKQEVCIYAWHDLDNNSWELLPLEDRIDSDSPFSCQDIMTVLEKIWENNFSWKDDDEDAIDFPFPTARPAEGESLLNKKAAWPFATATAPADDAEESAVEKEQTYEPGELIRIEESGGKMYEIRQPSADFSASFPGVLDMIEIKDPDAPKQDWLAILEATVAKHGLPNQMGATGWIAETQNFHYDGKPIATAEDGLKGWLYVERDDNGDGEPSWSNVEELAEVARAMIEDNNDDETSLNVNVIGAGEDDWDIRSVTIRNDEADGKSWDYEIDMDDEEFWEIVKRVMLENGEIEAPEDEDEEIDTDDIDVNTFLWSYCADMGGEQRYSYGYGVAYMEFDDGFKMGMTIKDGELYVHNYDGKEVTKDTVFE